MAFRRKAGDVVGCPYGLLDGRFGKVGGAGVAAPLAQVHRHTQRFVAVALHVFQLTIAHRHAQATTLLTPRHRRR